MKQARSSLNDEKNVSAQILKIINELLSESPQDITELFQFVLNLEPKYYSCAIKYLVKNITNDNKMMIFELLGNLLIQDKQKLLLPIISHFGEFIDDGDFRRAISKVISSVFKISENEELTNSLDDVKRVFTLNNILYNEVLTPVFQSMNYEITPLYFKSGLKAEDEMQKFKIYQDNQNVEMQTEYFWRLYDTIKESISSDRRVLYHLNPYERYPYLDGPVALLFAGGVPEKSNSYYPDELNCCLFAHHLREMGYKSDNILCFIENHTFDTPKFPLLDKQIQVFHDTVLCSHDSFIENLLFQTITETFNNAHVFAFSILKAVMDSKGPVLIYFSCHVDEYGLHFPFEPHELSEDDFVELCCILNTIGKHIIFILDCYDSSRFVSRCQPNRFDFIHFITSSLSADDSSGASLYTIPFCSNDEAEEEKLIPLSSMFFRFFADSLFSINDNLSLIEFVREINHESRNVGFEARLFSNQEAINVSIFFKSPLFRYFDYFKQIDNLSKEEFSVSNLYSLDRVIFIRNNEIQQVQRRNRKRSIDLEDKELTKIINRIISNNEKKKEIKNEPPNEPKIELSDQLAKRIIDLTVVKYVGSFKALIEFRATLCKQNLEFYEVYEWFKKEYKATFEAIEYSSYLVYAYGYVCTYTPEKKGGVIPFIQSMTHHLEKNKNT